MQRTGRVFSMVAMIVGAAGAGCAGLEDEGAEDSSGISDDTSAAVDCSPDALPDAEGGDPALAELSCRLGLPVDQDGFTPQDRGLDPEPFRQQLDDEPAAGPAGDVGISSVRTYNGGCTGWGGCSRVAAEGWEVMHCGPFLYAYMKFENAYGNLIASGTGFCLW